MNHLREAKMHAQRAEGKANEWAQLDGLLALAHAVIARVEQVNKAAEDAEIAAEREDLTRERMAARRAAEKIL